MLRIFSHDNIVIAHNIKNILENHGFKCIMKNDIISSAAGEVPPTEVWPEVWITNTLHAEQAKKIVAEAMHGNPKLTSWFCSSCSEKNAPAFELCWHCGADRAQQ